VTLCRPLPYRHHVAPLKRGWRNPRKGYGLLPRGRPGRRRDVGPVESVSSAISATVPPSQALQCHPRHCGNPGRRDTAAPAVVHPPVFPSVQPSSQRTDDDQTLEAAPGRVQNSPRRLPGARFAMTTINSATLCAMPPYVAFSVVRRDCKLSPLGL
jgi:predicted secreted protein